jgi:23S rRNA (adenine2030-N6)-methyltransferase
VQRLWSAGRDAPEIIKRYLAVLKTFNRGQALRVYPGSPSFMHEMLRAGDRMTVNELHPEDARTLRQAMGGDDRVKVEQVDAYQVWKASVPPLERRGIVLVDPPFEVRNEFELMARGLAEAHRRWATGVYALWYPIKDVGAVKDFHGAVKDLGIPDCLALDFYNGLPGEDSGLIGCGLVMVNAPYTLVDDMRGVMPFLIERMTGGAGRFEVTEIAGEDLLRR